MFNSLADFLEDLERIGQLQRVRAAVDPELEIAAITTRATVSAGSALFFENVRGYHPPVVTNLLGNVTRICRAVGAESLDELTERVAAWLAPVEPEGWLDKIKGAAGGQEKFAPRVVKNGLCQQVVKLGRDVNLNDLPALRSWPGETRRTITAGHIFTRDPVTQEWAMETVPLEILDRDRLGVAFHVHHRGAKNLASVGASQQMPVAVVLGGDPAYSLAATTLPREVDALAFAGLLRSKPVELVRCRTNDLEVPTDADLVIEGYLDPAEPNIESGPQAGAAGYYRPPSASRAIQVTAITQRTNPIFPAVVMGTSLDEPAVIGGVLARVFLPLVAKTVPEMVACAFPFAGSPHPFIYVSIRKTYPQQARKVASALWGLEHLMCTKLIVVVDEHVDVHDEQQVLEAIAANVHPGRDVFFHQGPAHPWDHAAPQALQGHAMGIDATAKLAAEHPHRWPERLTTTPEIEELVASRWTEYGLPPL